MKCCEEVKPHHYHCAQCHYTFATLELFDSHQVVSKRRRKGHSGVSCRHPERLGLVRGYGDTYYTPEALKALASRTSLLKARRQDRTAAA